MTRTYVCLFTLINGLSKGYLLSTNWQETFYLTFHQYTHFIWILIWKFCCRELMITWLRQGRKAQMTVKFLVIFRINIQVRFCNFDVSDTFHTYRDTSEKEAFLNFLKKNLIQFYMRWLKVGLALKIYICILDLLSGP